MGKGQDTPKSSPPTSVTSTLTQAEAGVKSGETEVVEEVISRQVNEFSLW